MKKLLERKDLLIAEMAEMLDRAEAETRALDIEVYEAHEKELAALDATIEKLETRKLTEDKGEIIMDKKQMEIRAAEELRTITTSTHANAVPEGLYGEIVKKVEEKSAVYAEAKAVNFVGDLAVLVDSIDGEAAILDETEELTETDLGTFDKVVLKDKRVATLVTVSKQMLNNSPVVTMNYIADKVSTKVANTIENQIFNATGAAKEFTSGLLLKGKKVQGDITLENILAMVSGLKAAYLKGAKFYCNRETFVKLSGLVDAVGRPLLIADVANDAPVYKLQGVQVVITDVLNGELVLANVGAAVMVKHGKTPQIELLQETFALKGSYGIMCEAFIDAAVVEPEAVVILSAATRRK